MSETRRSAFTLVELLVVISIIVILMSILLPALKYARSLVGQGICAKQIKSVNEAFHAYLNECDEKIPYTSSAANLETYEAICGFTKAPSGFGYLYETRLLEEPKFLYCPDAYVFGRDTADAARDHNMDEFETKFMNRDWLKCDYVIGYWVQDGCGPYPTRIGAPGDNYEELKKERVCWMADSDQTYNWMVGGGGLGTRPFFTTSHSNWKFMNVGMLDGSVRAVVEYQSKLPRGLPHDFYWPHNDRPMWGWWQYFGVGKGM